MNRRFLPFQLLKSAVLTVLLLCPLAGVAAPALDELLQAIRTQAAEVAAANREREASFRTVLEEQEKRTSSAVAQRDAAERRGNELSARYDANELRIEEMQQLLELHQGNLGELFGVTRQIAGDAAGVLGSSLITTEFQTLQGAENRVEFLRRVASATALPSILELERLWMELLNEMVADAKVVRFSAPVQTVDGGVEQREVVRIASFTAVSNGEYLGYLPEQQALTVMGRQPAQSEFRAAAERLQTASAEGTYVNAIVDPARGALLGLIVERPDIFERVAEGEVVGYLILAVGALGVLVALFQYAYLFNAKFAVGRQERQLDIGEQAPRPKAPSVVATR